MKKGLERAYENKIIAIFFMTWGFLFIDRLAIAFILPVIVPDLQLSNTDVGVINMAFTISWAVSAVVFSRIADKKGNIKRFLVLAGFLTSIFGAACALATSFEMLVMLRALVGIAEGPFSTFLMVALGRTVGEERLGVSVGIVNAGVSVIAATIAPVFLTQLVAVTSWQMTFFVAALPGFIFMIIVAAFLKPIPDAPKEEVKSDQENLNKKSTMAELWSYRNFRICFFLAMTHMSSYYIIQIFASLYWTGISGLSVENTGLLIAAAGIFGILWSVLLAKLSDIYGRRPILVIFYFFSAMPALFMFLLPGSIVSMVFYAVCAGIPGALGIFWINLIPMETLPKHLSSTGVSIPMSMGEIIGGAIVTTFAGIVADRFGLPTMMVIVFVGMVASLLLALRLKETAPRVLEKRARESE